MDRRSFIKKISTVTLAGGCSSSLLTGCLASSSIKKNQYITGKNNEITVNKTVLSPENLAVVQADTLNFPIFLHQHNDKYTALMMSCTHQKCTLAIAGDQLICPCHGSIFNKSGVVLKGPAEKSLLGLRVYEEGESIVIALP